MIRLARELEAGDHLLWGGHNYTILTVDVEAVTVRLTLDPDATIRLRTWDKVLVAA